ncbi:ferredoxin [Haladaptatus sp. T7]|nr:ferredoxin [Haladaptatus sp. T7]
MRSISYHSHVDSPFSVLGLDSDADDEEVVEAYRRRIKEAHPDHGGSHREFQRVRAAYQAIQSGDIGGEKDEKAADEERVEERDRTPKHPMVEFLNYEVIDDYDWNVDDDGLFDKAAAMGLDAEDYGQFYVLNNETLLEAAENRGYEWPFACRGGACANCAVAVVDGEMDMPSNHVLSSEMLDRGFRLSCISAPITDHMQVIYNIKHLPGLDELRLPPQQFGQARSGN